MLIQCLIPLFVFLGHATADVTVYSQIPIGFSTPTTTAPGAPYTGLPAYDPTVLQAPPVPNPAPPTSFTLTLQQSANAVTGLSIKQGSFFGFSVEMSVTTQVFGVNSTHLKVPMLNLLENIAQRAGHVSIRVGGNTQETAVNVDSLDDGHAIEKQKGITNNPTQTPAVLYTDELFYMLGNISSLVNVKWYLGVPFNDTQNLRLQIAEKGQALLGDNLIGLQLSNEPDLYAAHGHRPATYSPFDYFGEFGVVVNAINNDNNIPVKNMLIGPSVATGPWTPEMVWDTGFIPSYTNNLGALAVEHYPDDNCGAAYGLGAVINPQDEFPVYLNHTAPKALVAPYINSTNIAQAAGKPFLMFETNTASCGGFPGISASFGAALWGLDYGMQMAFSNFSGALLHFGGQNVYYNPFTAPPTNESTFHQFTVGSIYYSALILAEALGSSNTSQIIDLNANNENIYTPAYAIYENGALARVALFNYVTDPTGAAAYTATINVNPSPGQVKVKYLAAPSVGEKDNITWAGQTFGTQFNSDGRLQGSSDIQTVNCDTTANTCQIPVPAPGFALVFMTDDSLSESSPSSPKTFSTTAVTKTHNTATVDPSVLATSNGSSSKDRLLGGTSAGKSNGGKRSRYASPVIMLVVAVVSGVWLVKVWM